MDEVLAILVGSILGDGSLTPPSVKRQESQLHVGYHEKYLPYLEWLHQKLAPIGVNPIQVKRGFRQCHFYTMPSGLLGRLYRIFYPNGVKVVPEEIAGLLVHPLSLAVWYMDDGSLDFRVRYHANATLATFSFSENDCLRLSNVLERNFRLTTKVHRSTMRGKVYFRLYFPSESMASFMALIEPYVLPCFSHKILRVASSRGKT